MSTDSFTCQSEVSLRLHWFSRYSWFIIGV